MRVKEFKIIQDERPENVSKEACQLIRQGWQPFGPPVIDHHRILQVMVLYETNSKGLDLYELHSVLLAVDSYIVRNALHGSSEILGRIGEQLWKISLAAKSDEAKGAAC